MAYKIVNDDSLTSVANAIRVQGSISGTLEFPDGFVSAIQNLSPSPTLQTKTKTYTPTTSQQTESVVADSGYDGLDEVDVTVNAIPSQYKDTTDATATADKILSGYTAYANGQKLVGTASGGITPSGTIPITQNGQVDVTNYATADVNVSGGGGASNFVTGTFTTGSTASKVGSVTVPYTGNGYPIALVIYVEGGCYNPNISPWYSSNAKYAVGQVIITKCVTTTAPTYEASGSVEDNTGTIMLFYKSSTEGVYSRAGAINAVSYNAGNPTGTSTLCVKWHSDKSIYYITSGGASTKYGLHLNTTYRYYAVYSS